MNKRPSPKRVTRRTMTDEQLLQLGRGCRDGTFNDAVVRDHVCVALGLTSRPDECVANAREFCVQAWNLRYAKECT